MRKQYHIRSVDGDQMIWDVHRLVDLSKGLRVFDISLEDIRELDELFWFSGVETPTPRRIASHAKLIFDADLSYPIILCSQGRVMDGMHRVCHALLEDRHCIQAVQFATDPAPDYINANLEDLPY